MARFLRVKFGAACCGLGVIVWAIGAFCGPSNAQGAISTAAETGQSAPAAAGLLPYPIDVPTGPQTSAANCPNPPELSAPLPAGASIAAPSLVPAGIASLSAAGRTYDLTGTCEYTFTFPNDSSGSGGGLIQPDSITISYVSSGQNLYFPAGVAEPISLTYSGRTCNTTAEIVSAFGLAIAEQELNSGNCTSSPNDPSGTWGYARAANTAEQWAAPTQEPLFHVMYQSYEAGNIFFGQFQECMENPVGQQSTFVCSWDNFGPLF